MLKGMFVNCWGCHLTIKLDDKVLDWYRLDVVDEDELVCNASFCSKSHLDYWIKNDLIPLLVQEVFDKAIEVKPKKSNFTFMGSGLFLPHIPAAMGSGSFLPHIPAAHRGRCITCSKNGQFRVELVIYYNQTVASKGFCSLDCLNSEKIVES